VLTVEEIRQEEEFFNLRDSWNELLTRSESKNIFLTWDWLYTWWKYYGSDNKLIILLVKNNGKLVGIAPFCEPERKGIKTEYVMFLGSTNVGSDYLDFIIEKGMEEEVILTLMHYFNSRNNQWRFIYLSDFSEQSKSLQVIEKKSMSDHFYFTSKYETTCPYIQLPETYEDYLKSLSSNMRYNIKRKGKKFEKKFDGTFILVTDANDLEKATEEMISLNVRRMEMKNIVSPFLDSRFGGFHREIIASFFEKGWLRLCFVKVKDEAIGCFYNYQYGDKLYYYQSGFNPEWDRLSPGFLLLNYCIESAISEGMKEFDLLRGAEKFKYQWTDRDRALVNVRVYNKSVMNKLFYLEDVFIEKCKHYVKEFLS
jgi:CelD/BcsL family acetyltransferase involved in cellulose biosynthesis